MIVLTRLYKVNGRYVVAPSPEDAIRIFKESEDGKQPNIEIQELRLLAAGKYPDFAYVEKPDEED